MPSFDARPPTEITFTPPELKERIRSEKVFCLIGANNSGKSFILKNLRIELGEAAAYLGPQRYNNFNSLAPYAPKDKNLQEQLKRFREQLLQSSQNLDNSPFNVQQAIAELGDKGRKNLFEIAREVLGANLSLELSDPSNAMSQRYIACNGYNFSYASSGVRLIVSILTSLMDKDIKYFLIDEPELGISPQAQGLLADFLFDEKERERYFPHIKCIIFATHSSIFLHRQNIQNNAIVRKTGDVIDISSLDSLADFNRIHFSLLGNRLESLFLPSFILFVEGETDEIFLKRVLDLRFPLVNFSIINATNDSEMKRYAHMLAQIFPDLQNSPYRERVFAIVDAKHGSDIASTLKKKGIGEQQLVVWKLNGIEHYYPEDIMKQIFGANEPLSIIGDEITIKGTTERKVELARKVASRINDESKFPQEFEDKLIKILEKIIRSE